MTAIAILLALVGTAALHTMWRRIRNLEQALARVESSLASPHRDASSVPAVVQTAPEPALADIPVAEPPRADPRTALRIDFESLVGGRLPIWIGGVALVLAGIFLVRYSIESGLLGPGTRTVLAALFGLALVAASEFARRFPPVDDPRIGQSLAGAGVASLYGTLYMAAALYHLVPALAAFAAVLLVTTAALALALRHGPPTAVMALLGGFAAPLIAGFDAAGIGPLLTYLALFTAALFGLAIHRGWAWLALAAGALGIAWVNFLIYALEGKPTDLSAVGAFVVLLAAGASAALPATGTRNRWLRIAPLIAGLVQLVALAPSLQFDSLAWGFYLVLAAAALFLSWRDPLYLPGAHAALAFVLLVEALALLQPERSVTPWAAALAALLFAGPGHWFATTRAGWAAIALGGSAGPLLVAHACAPGLLTPFGWAGLELVAGVACANLAWRLRGDSDSLALGLATLLCALLVTLALAQIFPDAWISVPFAAAILALASWARHTGAPRLFELPALPFVAAVIAAALPVMALVDLVVGSITGDRLPYLRLPDLGVIFREIAPPTLAVLAILADPRQLGRARRMVGAFAIALTMLLLYALAKQALAIDTLERFLRLGFVERAILTQACLASGWLLLRRGKLRSLGGVLITLGLSRLVWFDLVVLGPVAEPQAVGAIPLFNAAVAHFTLAALWMWTLAPTRPIRAGAAALTLVATLAAVRQATHGDLLTGPIGTAENSGYSAALLGVALFWLWRGIATSKHDLRVAGLTLLTLVTFKVFLVDAAALDGVLRILSFLGLGIALIGIGWAYGRFLGGSAKAARAADETPA